jgi:hypothetical protein
MQTINVIEEKSCKIPNKYLAKEGIDSELAKEEHVCTPRKRLQLQTTD